MMMLYESRQDELLLNPKGAFGPSSQPQEFQVLTFLMLVKPFGLRLF